MSLKGAFAGVALAAVAFGLQHLDDLDEHHPLFSHDPATRCDGGRAVAPDSRYSGAWQGVRWEAPPTSMACHNRDHK